MCDGMGGGTPKRRKEGLMVLCGFMACFAFWGGFWQQCHPVCAPRESLSPGNPTQSHGRGRGGRQAVRPEKQMSHGSCQRVGGYRTPPSVPWVLLGGVQDLLGAPTSLGAALPGRMQRCVSGGVSPQNHGVCGWWGHGRATGPSLSQISVAAWLPATFIVVPVPWIGS